MPKKRKPVKTTPKPKKSKKGVAQTFVNTLKSRKQKQADILKELGF